MTGNVSEPRVLLGDGGKVRYIVLCDREEYARCHQCN